MTQKKNKAWASWARIHELNYYSSDGEWDDINDGGGPEKCFVNFEYQSNDEIDKHTSILAFVSNQTCIDLWGDMHETPNKNLIRKPTAFVR